MAVHRTYARKIPVWHEPKPVNKDRDFSDEERLFMLAMQEEKTRLNKLSLTPAEILRVAKRIGYRRAIQLPIEGVS